MTIGLRKTARGQQLDMDKLKLANEKVSAVGNMRVNARGDVLGTGNEIAAGRNKVMDQVYAVASAPTSSGTPKSLVPRPADPADAKATTDDSTKTKKK